MFRRYYYEPGDIFASIILFLIIASFLAVLAVYVGTIVLFIFLGIGLLIAFAYSCVVYIRALITAFKMIPSFKRHGTLVNFILKWLWLLKTTSFMAIKDNFSIAHSAVIKASSYRFLSFKKWMWLFVAPAVLVFGTALIVGLAIFQFGLFISLSFACLCLILAVVAVCVIGFSGLAFFLLFKSLISGISASGIYNFCFNSSATFSQFRSACSSYFKGMYVIFKTIWTDFVTYTKSYFTRASGYAIFNFLKYFYLASPLCLLFVASIYSCLTTIFGIIAFVALAIANLIWTAAVKIFVH